MLRNLRTAPSSVFVFLALGATELGSGFDSWEATGLRCANLRTAPSSVFVSLALGATELGSGFESWEATG